MFTCPGHVSVMYIIGQSHVMKMFFSATDARYEVYAFWSFVQFSLCAKIVQPQARAF